ncbi:MAG TPA: isoprenylcysteine carboxylmethyltransferase family protein [Longimicrobiales bacterium]
MISDDSRARTGTDTAAAPWRHVLSILLLPAMVVVVVPSWILSSRAATDLRWSAPWLVHSGRIVGILVLAAGLTLFAWCVWLFARVGRGTLAPWDPTRRLVAAGPYRYVRNPMITGVATMLLGEALFFGSALIGVWLIAFVVVNHLYFLMSEEPGLERRFGSAYLEYRQQVPRWLPRRRRG